MTACDTPPTAPGWLRELADAALTDARGTARLLEAPADLDDEDGEDDA